MCLFWRHWEAACSCCVRCLRPCQLKLQLVLNAPCPPCSPPPPPQVRAGTALAGSMLEGLVARGALGVFASHLHLLHALRLNTPGLTYWRMEVEAGSWDGPGDYPLQGEAAGARV